MKLDVIQYSFALLRYISLVLISHRLHEDSQSNNYYRRHSTRRFEVSPYRQFELVEINRTINDYSWEISSYMELWIDHRLNCAHEATLYFFCYICNQAKKYFFSRKREFTIWHIHKNWTQIRKIYISLSLLRWWIAQTKDA